MSLRSAALALPALTCLCALAIPLTARADASPAEAAAPAASEPALRPLAGLRYTIGQGEGSKATLTHPDGSVAAQVDLAGVLEVYAGADFPVAPNGLTVRLTAGVHQSTSSNGVSARRFPLEALLLYPVSPVLRLGGGVRYPAHLRFSGGGDASTDLTPTPSIVGMVEVKLGEHFAADLRYVKEQYTHDAGASRLDASHFDVGVSAIY